MEVADKNIMVLPELCIECNDCFRVECQLCSPCFTPEIKMIFSQSYLEHQNKMDFQRIFPPPIVRFFKINFIFIKNYIYIYYLFIILDKKYDIKRLFIKKSITC